MAIAYGVVEVWCGSYGAIEKIGRVTVPAFCWQIIKYNGTTEAYIFPNTFDVNQHPYTYYQSTVSNICTTSHVMLTDL